LVFPERRIPREKGEGKKTVWKKKMMERGEPWKK